VAKWRSGKVKENAKDAELAEFRGGERRVHHGATEITEATPR
jgi:hypothetical protein